MGVWGTSTERRSPDRLARLAAEQQEAYTNLRAVLADFIATEAGKDIRGNGRPVDEAALVAQVEGRLHVARMIYAVERGDLQYLSKTLGPKAQALSKNQWAQVREFLLARRYGNMDGAAVLHPNGGDSPYRRLHPVDWIRRLTDPDSFREFEETIRYCSVDQRHFPQYQDALARGIKETGLHSGLITGTATIGGHAAVLTINNFGLVGSSLCDEIGEKFCYAAHQALQTRTPLVSVAMGGGARMQEGTPSMYRNIPKVQHALNELEDVGVPHISIIADPTLGGTAISYGLRGDYMIVVEGSANIGFSGKRVVEQFQQRKVAADFQHGSWLLHRGYVDEVVATDGLAGRLTELLEHVAKGGGLADLQTRKRRRWKPKEEIPLDASPVNSAATKARTAAKPLKPLKLMSV
jgi:acetyl-CoA carboxylase carboxyl transferase subunit beta